MTDPSIAVAMLGTGASRPARREPLLARVRRWWLARAQAAAGARTRNG